MHVHSYFSGLCTTPFVRKFCRESYSDPGEVYEHLQRRGMNLFTLTDHDSIDAAEQLRHLPGFFLSEELTCRMPSGTDVHIGVYDFHERQHAQLLRRRNDLVSLLMYLTERRLFFSINHIFLESHGPARARGLCPVSGIFSSDRSAQRSACCRGQTLTPPILRNNGAKNWHWRQRRPCPLRPQA